MENKLYTMRKYWLCFPWSFTIYSISETRLFIEKGLVKTTYDETQLYRVVDVQVSRNLIQKMCDTGSIRVVTRDRESPEIILKNIKNCIKIKEKLVELVEKARKENQIQEINLGV